MGLLDGFTEQEEQKNAIDVLLELLNKENIELKTDLNIKQIKVLWQSYFFTELFDEDNQDKNPHEILWKSLLYFMELMTSLKRKRSSEIIEGVSKMKDQFLETSLFAGLAGARGFK